MQSVNSSEILTVFRKELKETARDWRTLCVGILIPLILYPVSLIVASKIMVERRARSEAAVTKLVLTGPGAGWFHHEFENNPLIKIVRAENQAPVDLLKSGQADVVVTVPKDVSAPFEPSEALPEITVQVDELKDSNAAFLRVSKLLNEARLHISEQRLTAAGIEGPWLKTLHFSSVNVENAAHRSGAWLSLTLPLTIVLLVLVATLFPALDLITGERERGTLPVLLVTAVQRESIVYGKLLVVFSIGLLTVALLILSLFLMLSSSLSKVEDGSGSFLFSLSPTNILLTVPLAFPLVLLFGAISVWISAYSRSFQQGQGYSVPYLMIAMFLSGVSLFPVKDLPAAVYVVPVANVCVCMTDILRGEINWPAVVTTFVSSLCYGLYVSGVAIDLLGKEEILFKIQTSPKRRNDFDRVVAVLYASVFIAMFYIGQIAQVLDKVYGMIATQLIVILLPAFAVVGWLRLPFKEVFSFKMPRWSALVGAPLMAPGSVLLTAGIVSLQNNFLPMSEAYAKTLTEYMLPKDQPMWIILFAMAVMPGICEEVLFRGAIFGLLRRKFTSIKCCILVGVLFGFFHLSGYRLLPTTALGIILTLMVYRTGSIFPSMLFHASHNALAITISSIPEAVWQTPQNIMLAILSSTIGVFLVVKSPKAEPLTTAAEP
jgi:sodium transport system permease protein